MKMGAEGHERPAFHTEVLFIRRFDGLSAQRGQTPEGLTARMVRETATEARPEGPQTGPEPSPTQPPPTDPAEAPYITPNGWRSWWPTPDLGGRNYSMPDPPEGNPPVLPTKAAPFVWMVEGIVATPARTWSLPKLVGVRALADAKDVSGREAILDQADVAITSTSLFMPAAALALIHDGSNSRFVKEWSCRVNGFDRDIASMQLTQDRRFHRLVVEDRN